MQEEKALTFMQMAEEAMGQVEGISATEALDRLTQNPDTLLVDVSDAADVLATGLPAGAVNITLGMLPVRADLELPEQFRFAGLQDRSRPVITICQGGPNGARAAKLLDDMGLTDVAVH